MMVKTIQKKRLLMMKKMNDRISVWPFKKAPNEIQKLTSQGGDEDWVVFVPKSFESDDVVPFWIEAMDSLREPIRIVVDDGVFFVGCH